MLISSFSNSYMHASMEPTLKQVFLIHLYFECVIEFHCHKSLWILTLMPSVPFLVKVCLLSFWLVNKIFYLVCERVVCKDLESKLVCSNDQLVGIFDEGLPFQCFIDLNHKGTTSCSLLCPFMCQDSCRVNYQFVAVLCFESLTNMLWCLIEQ